LIGPSQKKKKVENKETPPNRRFYGKMECFPLGPTYVGEKGRTFGAKHMELKGGAIGNTLREHIGNLKGNMLGTKEKLKKP
jgi:hypothetical protein